MLLGGRETFGRRPCILVTRPDKEFSLLVGVPPRLADADGGDAIPHASALIEAERDGRGAVRINPAALVGVICRGEPL